MKKEETQVGDLVYVICRNPHTATATLIQEAEVVENPNKKEDKVLSLNDMYYEFAEDDAVFPTIDDAKRVYKQIYDED
ncbi:MULTISPECIES: transcriptional regulator SplA domain-containing protein [Sporolactobacillus]|uniref:Transcriptional regulator of the spore photoproduct lyase operon n=1 Tax=Sporolactobacillus nakayamae TaxID=269670 RepID=A0A1I2R0F9_9BACL|nr:MULTISPECIES: transcriptional regulator SplA domain-containing protein [Sporolactobacillus]MCQ2011559.1 transcriptional regulator [Sporolactobacillus sp. STSJ-5]SFG33780.1 transcriptional regulator of the spore photoproduct lyase operon [Sporolactobacillus nakayamae]